MPLSAAVELPRGGSQAARGWAAVGRHDGWMALIVATACFALYNANGREIGNHDSQPTKFAARELLLRGTLTLNYVVGRTPQFAERSAFAAAERGRYRSAYSPVPSIAAAAIAWPLWKAGLIDIRADRAPALIAALAASILTAAAVGFAFLSARRVLPRSAALVVALGLGAGTGYWSTVSQTLWQHETAAFGLSLAILALVRGYRPGHGGPSSPPVPIPHPDPAGVGIAIGVGLGLAGAARPQLAVTIAILLVGAFFVQGRRTGWIALAIVAVFAASLMAVNMRWFGSPLGVVWQLEALHPVVHATKGSFDLNPEGLLGLLASPSRGLLIFSPIVILALGGVRRAFANGSRSPLRWTLLAALAQYLFYGCYLIWWGGHTYGPRYMLDVLPLLVPASAVALSSMRLRSLAGVLASLALTWSIIVAGTGAFCYPHDAWNTDPESADLHHERLWDWSDNQIFRCWKRGPSPQNFDLFH